MTRRGLWARDCAGPKVVLECQRVPKAWRSRSADGIQRPDFSVRSVLMRASFSRLAALELRSIRFAGYFECRGGIHYSGP